MAAFISISEINAHSLSTVSATARGSQNDFLVLIGLELVMLVLQIVNFRKARKQIGAN